MKPEDLQADGDRDLAERLLGEPDVKRAIEKLEAEGREAGARRQLLGTSIRLTPDMAPDVYETLDGCRRTLGLESPIESFVYPGAEFNAAAVRPERGRLLIIVSSGLLEAFEPDELRFVAGHELGHHLFDHHRIPVASLLDGNSRVSPGLVLRLFAWQRYAEISCDRAGVICAGGIEPAARALFKLASGLRGGRVQVRIDQFLSQVADLKEEASLMAPQDDRLRADWFSTHPFSPLRLRAADLFARSELVTKGGTPRAELEAQVADLMILMQPSYLHEKSGVAEAMRRLLFAGGVAIASASGRVKEEEIEELERLLGPGSLPPEVKPEVIRNDLPSRLEDVRQHVPPLRRAQVLRDLCVIARADGRVEPEELRVIRDIAAAIGVDPTLVNGSCS
ncbi:MAG TPA: M48 family metallopeptidase [Candidatus Polarisedimenticolia bacterium]|nr:M48 family metallopeptidase [Candidatus Polarisedimenticolia bacterium]